MPRFVPCTAHSRALMMSIDKNFTILVSLLALPTLVAAQATSQPEPKFFHRGLDLGIVISDNPLIKSNANGEGSVMLCFSWSF